MTETTTEAIASRLQNMIISSANMAIWLRDRSAIKKAMILAKSLATYPKSNKYKNWYPKAVILVNKLLLPENRDYWRSALPYERGTAEYHNWRVECLNRDSWKCQVCGDSKRLNVHHIQPYKDNSMLRIAISNGLTLCKGCHKQEHKRVKHGK